MSRSCDVCGGPIRDNNATGVCSRSLRCRAAGQRRWCRKNEENVASWHRRKKYGITPEQYEALFAIQGGACAICHIPETVPTRVGGKPRRLAVDHDHETGKVRALLCHDCNKALHARFTPSLLRAMAEYIQAHASDNVKSIAG